MQFQVNPFSLIQIILKTFQKVSFKGKIDNEKIIYLYNLNEDGEPGFDIINPINIENKNFLINRGWVKISNKNKPFITNNENFVGIFREKSKSSYFKPENDLPNNYWFKLEDGDLEKYTGLSFSNYIIYLSDSNPTKIPKPKNISANLSNNHLKYALTWFSLAISIFLIYLYFRKKKLLMEYISTRNNKKTLLLRMFSSKVWQMMGDFLYQNQLNHLVKKI